VYNEQCRILLSTFIIATKIDIVNERVVSAEEGKVLTEKMGGWYRSLETSASTGGVRSSIEEFVSEVHSRRMRLGKEARTDKGGAIRRGKEKGEGKSLLKRLKARFLVLK
jgi:hypothetical protein